MVIISIFLMNTPVFAQNSYENGRLFCVNKCLKICKFVKKVNPRISEATAIDIQESINFYSQERNIDPDIIAAILATESHFKPHKVLLNQNKTIDVGICQINTIWVKEFKRLKRRPLKLMDLKNIDYCIDRMTEILAIHKNESKNWYSKYHSKTKKLRKIYEKKIKKNLSLLSD